MGIKNNIFALKKATRYSLPFFQPSLDAGNSLKWLLGIFQDGGPLTHSQVLSTFQDGGRVKFPTLGTVVDVKIPTHVRFTKSNSHGLPGPPILGQTIDRCIKQQTIQFSLKNILPEITNCSLHNSIDTALSGRTSPRTDPLWKLTASDNHSRYFSHMQVGKQPIHRWIVNVRPFGKICEDWVPSWSQSLEDALQFWPFVKLTEVE